ncbi:MAG: hypothetical protein SangKO_099580 [Sandaracinaceae bacterium]
MTVCLSTLLDAPPQRVWDEVNRTALLGYVAAPLLTFEPVDPPAFPERWEERDYHVRLRPFGGGAVGRQTIRIERPSSPGDVHVLRDNGSGTVARRWDHVMTVEPAAWGRTRYTDRVEIEAGPLTPAVWAVARGFYGHRQRRWRRLVASGFQYGASAR